jgi:hypothetical protein
VQSLLAASYRSLFEDARNFNGEPATIHGRRLQDATRATRLLSEARNAKLAFETARRYRLDDQPEDRSVADLFSLYRAQELELRRDLSFRRWFTRDAVAPDALGFTPPTDEQAQTRAQVAAMLRRLDLWRAVAASIEAAGVARLDRLQFQQVNDQLAARGVPTRASGPDEAPFFSGEGLHIEVRATEEALYNLLIEMQRPVKGELRNRALVVEAFSLEKPDLLDAQDLLIHASVLAVAYRVNEESSYPERREATSAPRSDIPAPRRFR